MKIICFLFAILLFLSGLPSGALAKSGFDALISPGELAASHSRYEGITNCTKCHSMGSGVPDGNCLDCHDKLAAKIKSNRGLHAKYTEPCIKCHSDHKGRSYRMIALEKDKFNHDRTEYPLRDRHTDVSCRKCHKTEGSYAGLSQACISCHKDEHNKQLDADCGKCHNIKGWKDIKKFNHAIGAAYALTGKHLDIKCEKCHAQGKYKPVAFKSCADCHKDPHRNQFPGKNCEACHTVKGWASTLFDHASPEYKGYRLEGRHLKVSCEKCHAQGKYKPVAFKSCADCHKDPHRNQFPGKNCEACHTVKGWASTLFDHASPEYKGYRLEGRHLKVNCEKCHAQGKYKPLASECQSCHLKDDAHKDELGKVCKKCHITEGWKKITLDHKLQTSFPLVGKHADTQCEKCHKNKAYKIPAQKCADCHKDEHKGKFKEECNSCHTQADWEPRTFDHKKKAGFELGGLHRDLPCTDCHAVKGEYRKLSRYCNQCHTDPHFNQFGG
ncbi:MAG: hypothetical protein AAB307_06965, partial [Deltaproteobacteria bacterium]